MTRNNPQQSSMMTRLQSNLADLYKQFGARNSPTVFDDPTSFAFSDWIPTVDIKENRKRFVITVDVPGVDPKDIEVKMENGCLSISAERKQQREESDDTHRLLECSYGAFERRIRLPDTADESKVSAKNLHGVLTVTINKRRARKKAANKIRIE